MCLKCKGHSDIRGTSNPEYGSSEHNECNVELIPLDIVQYWYVDSSILVVYHFSHVATVHCRIKPWQLPSSICQLFTLFFILSFVHNDCNPPSLRNFVCVPVHPQHHLDMTSHWRRLQRQSKTLLSAVKCSSSVIQLQHVNSDIDQIVVMKYPAKGTFWEA